MLKLDVQHNGRSLSLELPMNTNMLTGELRAIGITEPLEQIHRSEYLLSPANELGEHFMKLLRPEDSLYRIASYYNVPATLEYGARREMEALIATGRFRSIDHISDYIEYGPDALDGLIRLTRDGRSVVLPTSNINMFHCFGVEKPMGLTRVAEMDIAPVSEFGRRLIAELQPYSDTVATLNVACSLAWDVPDITAAPARIMESARIFQMPMDTEELRFYCPLFLSIEGGDGAFQEADPDDLVYHAEEIHEALDEYGDMAEHLPEGLRPKIASVKWGAAKIGPALYGEITCELRVPFTPQEKSELAGWITEMNADGVFSDFEMAPLETDCGDLYVGLWRDSDACYLLPEDEFRAQVLEQALDSQGFGAMGGMS